MTQVPIPDDHHVVRHCKPSTCPNGRPLISAFMLREHRPDETCLSVNWLEHPSAGSIKVIRETFQAKGFDLRANGRFATLHVHRIRDRARRARLTVCIVHTPERDDPSHADICGPHETPTDRQIVAGLLHACVIADFPARTQ
ncbi:MAG: hypothetical protein OXG64_00795 [Chloroflexi bacterium]|nr:hypothetical protein [Chloroflexota bacterium]